MAISKLRQVLATSLSLKLTPIPSRYIYPTLLVIVQHKLVCMTCYLYSESESQPAIPACNCHYAGQSCSFSHTLFSTSRPPSADPAANLRCALIIMLICIYTIIQLFNRGSGYVVSLATPTKAEPLYKVHNHAGPCSQFYDRGCPHLEVIFEYFCLFLFILLYRVSLSEVHCKQEQ